MFSILFKFAILISLGHIATVYGQKTSLKLYTKSDQTVGTQISFNKNISEIDGFNSLYKSYVLTHGFASHGNSSWLREMKKSLFQQNHNINVFILDWKTGAKLASYMIIKSIEYLNDVTVPELTDHLINFKESNNIRFVSESTNILNVHLIGHSLGAHVCGLVGKKLKLKGFILERVTGLDPAGPGFEQPLLWSDGLSRDSASYVDVIRTSRLLGFRGAPLGHREFFPNNGKNQLGCHPKIQFDKPDSDEPINFFKFINPLDLNLSVLFTKPIICSHRRAHQYFIESILNNSKFRAVKCSNFNNFQAKTCGPNSIVNVMGFFSSPPKNGLVETYYLETGSSSPYSLDLNGKFNNEENPSFWQSILNFFKL